MKNLENQVAQIAKTLAERLLGSLPSNTEVNPKESLKSVTLRIGKELSMHAIKETGHKDVNPQQRTEQERLDHPNTKAVN